MIWYIGKVNVPVLNSRGGRENNPTQSSHDRELVKPCIATWLLPPQLLVGSEVSNRSESNQSVDLPATYFLHRLDGK